MGTDYPQKDCQIGFWNEIETAASKMFLVWTDGSDLVWAQECWEHFSNAGLTGNSTVLETASTYLRLVALARIYREFCRVKWDEHSDTPLNDLAENLEIDSVALGILAGSTGEDFSEVEDDYELREAALLAATDKMRNEIFTCLARAYGGKTQLYIRMSRTNQPADEENMQENFEVTPENSSAFQYVTSGFVA